MRVEMSKFRGHSRIITAYLFCAILTAEASVTKKEEMVNQLIGIVNQNRDRNNYKVPLSVITERGICAVALQIAIEDEKEQANIPCDCEVFQTCAKCSQKEPFQRSDQSEHHGLRPEDFHGRKW